MKLNKLLFNVPWQLGTVFLLLSIGIMLAGYLFYEKQRGDLREEKEGELKAVADLKVGQIEDWYAERLRDADVISGNPLLGPLIESYVSGRSTEPTHRQVVEWMTLTKQVYNDRDIVLLDSKGNSLIGIPESPSVLAPEVNEAISRAIQSKRVITCDFHRESSLHLIQLDLVIPVLCPTIDRTGNDVVGIIILGIDPRKFLYPLIEFWPTPSKSSESILLRREGDEVVFLNELRHRENTALTLRFPVSGSSLPAALAAQGREGIVEGIDYRNVPVLAATRKIPGTPWFLAAKVDNEEVYAPIRERGLLILAVMCLLILASGASAAAFWRTEHAMQYKRQFEAEAARRVLLQRFEYLTKHANDIILLFDETYNIVEANDRALSAYGYTHKELLGLNLERIHSPASAAELPLKMKEVEESGGLVSEAIHRRKDGSTFPVEVSSRAFKIEGRTFYQSIIRNITKRKQAEEDLYNANQMLQLVLDTIPQRVFWKDRNFSYLGCNKTFAKDAGLGDPGEVIALDDFKLPWKDRAHLYQADDNLVMESDTPKLSFEEQATTPDGGQIWVRTSKVPLHDRDGKVIGMLGSYEDITERKRAEETVQRERNLLRTLIDNLPDLIYFKDAEGRYLLNNRPHLRSMGAEHQEDVLGKTTFDFNPRELALRYAEDEMEVVRTGKGLFGKEEIAVHRDTGEERWHLTSKVPLVDEQGKVTGIVGISRDITERKRAQEALLSERILLRTLIDNLPDGIYAKDKACRKTLANPADVRNTGRKSEAEVLGKDDFEIFPTEVAAAFFADDQSVIQTGQPVLNREEYLYDSEGQKRWLLTSKLPLRDEKGEIIGLVGIGRDITAHKHAEEALLEAAEKFRLVFDNVFDGISIFEESPDPGKHRLVECNARYAEMAGRSREELLRDRKHAELGTNAQREQ